MSEQVNAIFSAASWAAGEKEGWNGSFVWSDASVIGGIDPWGTPRVTAVGARTLEDAAAWLVQHAIDLRLAPESEPEETPAHEDDAETGAEANASDRVEAGDESVVATEFNAASEPGRLEALDERSFGDEPGEYVDDLGSEILDADFYEPTDPLIEGADFAETEDHAGGPIAYAASDLDALVREKLGRLSQIARSKKSVLQEGWDLAEFSYLQNLVQRMERGEASDDPAARDRFFAISELSRAMSQIDAARDALEASLEQIGRARDYVGAVEFDPEQGWP